MAVQFHLQLRGLLLSITASSQYVSNCELHTLFPAPDSAIDQLSKITSIFPAIETL
jgi:hypothetical protein